MKKTFLYDFCIVVSFFILAYMSMALAIRSGIIYVGSDRVFHLARLEEAYMSVKQFKWPSLISTYTFGSVGQAVGVYYPNAILAIYGIIRMVFVKNIISYYVFLLVNQFLGLLIAFYSAKSLIKKRKIAYLFAIILRLSAYVQYDFFPRADIGENWAIIFIPLVLAGFYKITIDNSRKTGICMLCLGLIFETYSHFLTTVLTLVLLITLYICSLSVQKNKISILKQFVISALLYVLATLFFFYPLLIGMIKTKIFTPNAEYLGQYNLTLGSLFSDSLSNTLSITSSPNIGTILILVCLLGILVQKKNVLEKSTYMLGTVLFLLSTNLFPWNILRNTPVNVIQFPWRFLTFAIVFLSFFAAIKFGEHFTVSMVIGFLLLLITINIGSYVNFAKSETATYGLGTIEEVRNNDWPYFMNNQNYQSKAKYRDYIPLNASKDFDSIYVHDYTINGHLHKLIDSKIKAGYQSVTYTIKRNYNRSCTVKLPFLIYDKADYLVEVNGHKTSFDVKKNQLLVRLSSKEKVNNIRVTFITPEFVIILRVLSIIIVLILVILLVI